MGTICRCIPACSADRDAGQGFAGCFSDSADLLIHLGQALQHQAQIECGELTISTPFQAGSAKAVPWAGYLRGMVQCGARHRGPPAVDEWSLGVRLVCAMSPFGGDWGVSCAMLPAVHVRDARSVG